MEEGLGVDEEEADEDSVPAAEEESDDELDDPEVIEFEEAEADGLLFVRMTFI